MVNTKCIFLGVVHHQHGVDHTVGHAVGHPAPLYTHLAQLNLNLNKMPWTDGFLGTDFSRHRPQFSMRHRFPNIHHGPQTTAIHTTFQKNKEAEYKIVFSYNESPRRFKEVLSRLTTALVGQNVTKCKVFTNPTHREKLAFVYIPNTSVTELLTNVNIIKREFQPAHIDLRENMFDASILMSLYCGNSDRPLAKRVRLSTHRRQRVEQLACPNSRKIVVQRRLATICSR